MAQMKEQIKTPEKQLSDEEIDNPSDAEFKTLVMRMLTGWVWSQKRGKNEALQSEIKKTIQETNSEGKKTGTQINDLDQKEEINILTATEWRYQNSKKKRGET